jgi:transcriptional regulator with XRE-family HTH domain
MNTFGQVVKALRKVDGVTLEVVARKIGSHKGYVSGIENGKVNPPSPKITLKIAKLYGPSLEKLGVVASEADWVELAWLSKSPGMLRDRCERWLAGNPLARMEIEETPEQPAVAKGMVIRPAAEKAVG